MAARKTEGGVQFPPDAYLVVPDPDRPETWKLRVWEDLTNKVTRRQLGRAAAALGPGFRDRKVQLSRTDRETALRKLRGLYTQLKVAKGEWPAVLQQALVTMAVNGMHRRARALRGKVQEGQATELAALVREGDEDLEILEEYHDRISFFTAVQDGEPAFENVVDAVGRALSDRMAAGAGADPAMAYDWRVMATFPHAILYRALGKTYQVSYAMAGTDAVLGDDTVEVELEAEPVAPPPAPETQSEAREQAVIEPYLARPLAEAHVDRATRVIENTVLITSESANGIHGRRRYTDKALQQITEKGEGLPAYANHVRNKEDAFKPRPVEELIGRHRNLRFEAGSHRVMSNLHILEHQAPWVFSLVDELGDVVGNSLVSQGMVRMEGTTEVVEEILALRSGDLVSDPASTRGLFEHREAWLQTHPGGEPPSQRRPYMRIDEIKSLDHLLQFLKEDAGAAAAVKELAVGAELKTIQEQAKVLTAELKTTKDQLGEAQIKLDGYKAAETRAEKAKRLDEALKGSELGKKYPDAVTDGFRGLLIDLDEAKWVGLIKDRQDTLDKQAARGAAPQSRAADHPREGALPEGTHARAYAALAR